MRTAAGSFRGRAGDDLPGRGACEVLARRREGAYWLLSLSAPRIATRARPGQFVTIAVESQDTILRRPFSIARVTRQGSLGGTIEVVFDAHGPGTRWLTGVEAHDVLDVIGPLGSPFPLPQRTVSCLLVGGGYGAAPLLFLAEVLSRQGLRVDMIIGAADHHRILNAIQAKRLTASVTFTTEDGSYGERGRVTDVFDAVVERCRTGVVYACGPNPMLRAISERCRDRELPVQVAVEELMACGIGVCFTCVVPVRDRDGTVRMRRSCLEGPVFNGARIAWEESRFELGPDPQAAEGDEARSTGAKAELADETAAGAVSGVDDDAAGQGAS